MGAIFPTFFVSLSVADIQMGLPQQADRSIDAAIQKPKCYLKLDLKTEGLRGLMIKIADCGLFKYSDDELE